MDRARASDSPEVCPLVKSGRSPSRHKGRPKLLNLPPEAKHPADTQRSFKTKTRTLEESRVIVLTINVVPYTEKKGVNIPSEHEQKHGSGKEEKRMRHQPRD